MEKVQEPAPAIVIGKMSEIEKKVELATKYKILTTFFVIVLLWHPTIMNYSFSIFMCVDYEDGSSYLRKDTAIQCWEGRNFFL